MSSLSLVSWGGSTAEDRLFLFSLDPAGVPQFWTFFESADDPSGSWTGPVTLPGPPLLGPPVGCTWGPGKLVVVGVVEDGLVWYSFSGDEFSAPVSVTFTAPRAVNLGPVVDAIPMDPTVVPAALAGAAAGTFNTPKVTAFGASTAAISLVQLADHLLEPPTPPTGGPVDAAGIGLVQTLSPSDFTVHGIHATADHHAKPHLFFKAGDQIYHLHRPDAHPFDSAWPWEAVDLAPIDGQFDIGLATNVDVYDLYGVANETEGMIVRLRLAGGAWALRTFDDNDALRAGGTPVPIWFDALTLLLFFRDRNGILRAFGERSEGGFTPLGPLDGGRLSYGLVRGTTAAAAVGGSDGTRRIVVVDVDPRTNQILWASWDGTRFRQPS